MAELFEFRFKSRPGLTVKKKNGLLSVTAATL